MYRDAPVIEGLSTGVETGLDTTDHCFFDLIRSLRLAKLSLHTWRSCVSVALFGGEEGNVGVGIAVVVVD